ncbi:MAG: ATP-dependent DNA ligase [Opitutales bacterium]
MKRFAELIEALDSTTSTNAKVDALASYFAGAPPEDAIWALYFLMGRRIKRLLPTKLVWQWVEEASAMPDWLIRQCYTLVGDQAECISLLVDQQGRQTPEPLHRVVATLIELRAQLPHEQEEVVKGWWQRHSGRHLFVLNKLLTGAFRIGVSQKLVTRALAQVAGVPEATLAHRIMGDWEPTPEFFQSILSPDQTAADLSQPYPFFLASPLEKAPEALGPVRDWQLEWKWDGIRGQLIRRGGETVLWSRGEELVTLQHPEVVQAAARLPEGLVLDGELLAWRENAPLPFADLQRRLNRKSLTRSILMEVPMAFMAYDLLECDGEDWREQPLHARRERLEAILERAGGPLRVSPCVEVVDWAEAEALRQTSRERLAEGLMIKRRESTYQSGRKRGDWWKWKVDPFSVDAVLLYAEAGHGRRANLFTDYTFGVWDGTELTPFTKAYSGLSDAEIARLDKWIRQHTLDKFGPVRVVPPEHVFELHFEGIAPSTRHRSGIALRFPRIHRWRTDKTPAEADRIETLQALIGERAEPRQQELFNFS